MAVLSEYFDKITVFAVVFGAIDVFEVIKKPKIGFEPITAGLQNLNQKTKRESVESIDVVLASKKLLSKTHTMRY